MIPKITQSVASIPERMGHDPCLIGIFLALEFHGYFMVHSRIIWYFGKTESLTRDGGSG
jgi:hypothetical protein